MLTILRTMIVQLCRDAHTWMWNMAVPLGLLIGLGLYFRDSDYGQRLLSGVLATNLLFGAMTATAFYVIGQRNRGVYKLLRATPLPVLAFVTALTGARLAVTLGISAALIGVGIAVLDTAVTLSGLLLLLPVLVVGSVCFTALGFVVANLAREEQQASILTNLISMPLLFTSEAFYSLEHAPQWIAQVGRAQPFHYLVASLRAAVESPAALWQPLAVLSGFAILSVALAVWTFRWDPEQRLLGRRRPRAAAPGSEA